MKTSAITSSTVSYRIRDVYIADGEDKVSTIKEWLNAFDARKLCLSGLRLEDQEVPEIIEALIPMKKVTEELNLSHNKIADAGAMAIAPALKDNTTLTKLDISDNNISDNGAEALLNMLADNRTLVELDLSGNNLITPPMLKNIRERLEENKPQASQFSSLCSAERRYINKRGRLSENTGLLLDAPKIVEAVVPELNLDLNEKGDEGTRALASSRNDNTTLKLDINGAEAPLDLVTNNKTNLNPEQTSNTSANKPHKTWAQRFRKTDSSEQKERSACCAIQ